MQSLIVILEHQHIRLKRSVHTSSFCTVNAKIGAACSLLDAIRAQAYSQNVALESEKRLLDDTPTASQHMRHLFDRQLQSPTPHQKAL
jgi:hypothetical protein